MTALQSKSRRRLLYLASFGTASVALVACGATPAAAPTATTAAEQPAAEATAAPTVEPTKAPTLASTQAAEIEVWADNWGEEFNIPMESIGQDFTEATGIKTKWLFYDEEEGKLLTTVAGGTPPDTVMVDMTGGVPMYAQQGTFMPLDDFFAQSGIKPTDFIKSTWEACVYEGKAYAIPGGADYYCLVYSKDVYRDAGLDPEQPPKTLEEWVAHSEQIYKYDDSGNVVRMGMSPTELGIQAAGFIFGGQFYDLQSRKVICNQGGVVEALDWEVDLAKKFPIEKVNNFREGMPGYSQPNSGLATGRIAYMINGFWFYEPLDKYAPDLQYGVAFIPTLKGTPEERERYIVEGWSYSIPQGSKHPAEAWQFMKYVFYDNAWYMGVKTINGCSVISQLDKFFEGVAGNVGADNRLAPYLHFFKETGAAGGRQWPMMAVAPRYYDEIQRAEDFAVHGEKTVQVALDECAQTVQNELDKVLSG